MSGMFNLCFKLEKIKGINNFDTKNVTDMSLMFNYCNELKYLKISIIPSEIFLIILKWISIILPTKNKYTK